MEKLTIKDVAEITGLSTSNLRWICKRKKKLLNEKHKYSFYPYEWSEILLKKHRKLLNKKLGLTERSVKIPNVIYVTRTWEIYESKMNYLTE